MIVTATDDSSGAANDTLLVTINPVNDPPSLTNLPPEINIPEDSSYSVDLDILAIDIDDPVENLTWAASLVDTSAADKNIEILFDSLTNVVTLIPDPDFTISNAQLAIQVCDTSLTCDTDTITVNVTPVNDAPVFSALPDTISFPADSSVTFNIWDFVFDPETPDDQLSFEFSAENDSVLISYNAGSGEATISAIAEFGGKSFVAITASDPNNGTSEGSLLVIVEPIVSIGEPLTGEIPAAFALQQNYPNPFNPSTEIQFALPSSAFVELTVFNTLGQRVRTLVKERLQPGKYQTTWDGRNDRGHQMATGVYIYRIQARGVEQSLRFNEVRKMILIK